MKFNNTFVKAIKKQLDQRRIAKFSMLNKARNPDLPIDLIFMNNEYVQCYYMVQKFRYSTIDMMGIFYKFSSSKTSKIETLHTKLYDLREGVLPLQTSIDK